MGTEGFPQLQMQGRGLLVLQLRFGTEQTSNMHSEAPEMHGLSIFTGCPANLVICTALMSRHFTGKCEDKMAPSKSRDNRAQGRRVGGQNNAVVTSAGDDPSLLPGLVSPPHPSTSSLL